MAGKNAKGMDEKLKMLKQGIATEMPSSATITVKKQPVTQPELLAQATALSGPFEQVDATHAVLAQQVAVRDNALPATRTAYDEIVTAIMTYVGKGNTAELAKYGIVPKKPRRQLTGEEIVAAAARAEKTRELRGTKGSKQKQSIKATGEVTVSTSMGAAAGSSDGAVNGAGQVNGSSASQSNGSSAPATNGAATPAPADSGGTNGASH